MKHTWSLHLGEIFSFVVFYHHSKPWKIWDVGEVVSGRSGHRLFAREYKARIGTFHGMKSREHFLMVHSDTVLRRQDHTINWLRSWLWTVRVMHPNVIWSVPARPRGTDSLLGNFSQWKSSWGSGITWSCPWCSESLDGYHQPINSWSGLQPLQPLIDTSSYRQNIFTRTWGSH